jgi:hypothetical protein
MQGGLIETIVEFLENNGVDALSSLCHAIESLGQSANKDGEATVWMGPLYDPACDYLRESRSAKSNA